MSESAKAYYVALLCLVCTSVLAGFVAEDFAVGVLAYTGGSFLVWAARAVALSVAE